MGIGKIGSWWGRRGEGLRASLPRLIWGATLAACIAVAAHVSWFLLGTLLLALAVLLVREVTRRESAEAGERLQAELFRTTIENIDQGLMMVDAEGRVRVSNQRAIELLSLPAEFVTPGRLFEDIVRYQLAMGEYTPSLDPYRFWQSTRLLSGHASYERTRPNGTVLDIRTVPLPSGGAVRTYTDITSGRRAEKAISESEARYRLLAENARDIIVRSTADGRRLYVSQACREILGYEPEELLAMRLQDTIHPDDVPLVEAGRRLVLEGGGEDVSTTYRVRHKAGHWLWIEARRRAVRNDAGEPVELVSVLRDVTERQRQSEELQRAKETAERALEQARKSSEAKSEFLAAMSHEIRTPLHSIIGFTSLLLDEQQHPAHRRRLELIQESGTALLTLVDDILDFSKIEAGQVELEPQPFQLPDFTEATAAIVRGLAASKNLTIELTLEPELPAAVVGDPDRIRQILLNLLNNAVKFTAAGSVALDVRRDSPGGDWIRFSVRDTGIGIPEHNRDRLFERFSQVDSSIRRRFGGTGLGLAISKRLVDLMGGRIGVESEPGVGSLFWFSIPLARADAAPVEMTPPPEPSASGSAARILLVEDLAVNQEIARALLEKAGHQVDMARNGEEAVEAVEARHYDLVLMDIQMPVLDGLSATRRIRALPGPQAQVPIIAMTANVLPDQVETFQAAGLNDHLGKPFDRQSLLEKVERWRRGASDRDPAMVVAPTDRSQFDPGLYRGLLATVGTDRLGALLVRLQSHLTDPASEQLLAGDDRVALGNYAHSVISTAGMLGFGELSRVARELEDCCREGRELAGAVRTFRVAAAEAVDEIDRLEIELHERAANPGRRRQA
jgi:PAS domain S-box-containing protein